MNETITVPDYIKDTDGMIAYIRSELEKRGIDPATIYAMNFDDNGHPVIVPPRADPVMIEMSFAYDEAWEKNKHLWFGALAEPKLVPVDLDVRLALLPGPSPKQILDQWRRQHGQSKKSGVDHVYQAGFCSFGD